MKTGSFFKNNNNNKIVNTKTNLNKLLKKNTIII